MRILFCTNVFEVVENGPVKFANLLLQINEQYPQHELHVLTEDLAAPRRFVHKVFMRHFIKVSPFSQFVRMISYHRAAMRLRQTYPFEVLVYNNALVGFWSVHRFENTFVMINDDNNLSASFSWWQTISTFSGLKRFVFKSVEALTARKSKSIIVNSDYLRELVAGTYRISRQKVHRLYKAVEVPDDSLSALPIDPSAPIRVLFVKNDYLRGGMSTLLEALSLLPYHFVLTIAGPALSDQEKIISLVKSYSNVEGIFLGKVPQQSVKNLLKESHIFCVPSYREALGVDNMEAMAQRVPVISTDVGGIPEVLDYGRCGWLVPVQDAPALADAIEDCISDSDLRAIKVANAYEQVHRFNTNRMFEDFLKILACRSK